MSEITQAMRGSSRAGTVLGIATMIFGVLAMMMPMVSGLTVATVVAVLMIAGGIARTIYAFKAGSFGKGALVFLFGGFMVLCGIVMLARPLLGLASLTMVLAFYFLAEGILEVILGFRLKGETGWFWMVLGGVASLVLAVMIWRQWPVSGAWAIGILVGVRLIMAGWQMIALGGLGEMIADEVESEIG